MNNVVFKIVVRRTAPGRVIDGDLTANGVVVETGCDLDLEIAKLAFCEGRRALPQAALDAYVPPPSKSGRKPELAPPSLNGVTRIYIELRACAANLPAARRLYLEATGRVLDETLRRGYSYRPVRNRRADWFKKYEHRTEWYVQFYDASGAEMFLPWTCKETGEPTKRLYCKETALHLLRLGYDLGYNDVLAEDRTDLVTA